MGCETGRYAPVQKLNLVSKYFRDYTFKSCKVLDIGGISGYRHLLEQIFESATVCILNADDNVKSTPSVQASALELPFIDEAWDVVTAFDIIEHLTLPDVFLSECHRVLKHNGFFIISSPNLATLYNRILLPLGFMPYHYEPSRYYVGRIGRCRDGGPRSQLDMGHISVFTYGGLKALLHVHGFQTVHARGFSYTDYFYVERNPAKKREVKTYRLRRGLNAILPRSAREGILIIAKKLAK